MCFPGGISLKNPFINRTHKSRGLDLWVGKIPKKRKWNLSSAFMGRKWKDDGRMLLLLLLLLLLSRFSRVRLCATPWTAAHQALLSLGFSRQEYWSGLPLLSLGDLPNLGIKLPSALQVDSLPLVPPAAAAKSLQSCLTLCNPRDGSPVGSSVPGVLQARTLEWGTISLSNA